MKSSDGKHNRMNNLLYYSLIILFALVSTGFSRQNNTGNLEITDNEKANYIDGINSENPGLKASCIYFAGRYRLSEAGEMLVEELKKSEEEDLSLLIAWSIYRVGDENCLKELKKITADCNSKRLKTFYTHLKKQKDFELAFERSKQS